MKSKVTITENRLEMERVFHAPRELVFEAWKEPEQVQKWWGCAQTSKVESEIDFRVGGVFRHHMVIETCGDCVYDGVFDEIVEPERIAFHAEFGGCRSDVTVDFIDQGESTKLVLTQTGFPDQTICQYVSEGFTAAFEKLARSLEPAAT